MWGAERRLRRERRDTVKRGQTHEDRRETSQGGWEHFKDYRQVEFEGKPRKGHRISESCFLMFQLFPEQGGEKQMAGREEGLRGVRGQHKDHAFSEQQGMRAMGV